MNVGSPPSSLASEPVGRMPSASRATAAAASSASTPCAQRKARTTPRKRIEPIERKDVYRSIDKSRSSESGSPNATPIPTMTAGAKSSGRIAAGGAPTSPPAASRKVAAKEGMSSPSTIR
jgi:hypothetical protein